MSRLTILRRTEADVRCHHCGDSFGTLRCSAIRPEGPMVLRSAADGVLSIVRPPLRLTCPVCAGPTVVEERTRIAPFRPPIPAQDLPPRPA
jgi:hypothetical protein